jgi:hypothetical protein
MDEKKEAKKLVMTNTKQEMLDAYNTVLKQLQEKQAGELRPEKKMEEKKTKEAVAVAESLGSESVAKEINNLKLDVNKMLTQLYDRLDAEVNKFMMIQNAIAAKERDIQELYEIEKSAMTLAALIEAQNLKRQEFAPLRNGTPSKRRGRSGRKRNSTIISNGNSSLQPTGINMRRPSSNRNSRIRRKPWKMR